MKGHCFKLISDGSTSKGLGMLLYHLNPSNFDIFYPMPVKFCKPSCTWLQNFLNSFWKVFSLVSGKIHITQQFVFLLYWELGIYRIWKSILNEKLLIFITLKRLVIMKKKKNHIYNLHLTKSSQKKFLCLLIYHYNELLSVVVTIVAISSFFTYIWTAQCVPSVSTIYSWQKKCTKLKKWMKKVSFLIWR